MHLSGFDAEAFLRDYWQKKPLLIRAAWDTWHNPLEPDELAGLACESDVESRLVVHGEQGPSLEHGPLPESRFGRLGRAPWTLLVQAVDHHVPSVAALLEPFRFIPNWRIDDVMVSYAVDGGGVGPHFDQYDVFLVQGLGRRRWQIGGQCDADTPLQPHDDLRLLADFRPTEEWILEPGDILYLPPRFAHDGIAVGDDCMTYSIGFRAPSRAELIESWAQAMLEDLEDADRYADPDLAPQDNPGAIDPAALARGRQLIAGLLDDPDRFARWFGEFVTTPKNPEIDWRPEQVLDAGDIPRLAGEGMAVLRNPASRFAFVRREADTLLFVDGQAIACPAGAAPLAERLCASDRTSLGPACVQSAEAAALLARLYNDGRIAFEPEN